MTGKQTESNKDESKSVFLASRLATWSAAIFLPIMGLGNLSEAVLLMEEVTDKAISTFTHLPEYEDLSYLKVGTTSEFVEDIFKVPQVRRSIGEGITANYYFNKKYLLTIFEKDSEVRAYTVLALDESFHPTIFVDGSQEYELGNFTLSNVPGISRAHAVDWTKTLALYIEETDMGLESLGQSTFLGWLTYGAGTADSQSIGELYNTEILDETDKQETAQTKLRQNIVPNFYGGGKVSLDVLEASILTTSQFGNYATAYK